MTPLPTRIGPRLFSWGERTYVAGILNVTPDSFSGDGLVSPGRGGSEDVTGSEDVARLAVAQARSMVAGGADMLDITANQPGRGTRPWRRTRRSPGWCRSCGQSGQPCRTLR